MNLPKNVIFTFLKCKIFQFHNKLHITVINLHKNVIFTIDCLQGHNKFGKLTGPISMAVVFHQLVSDTIFTRSRAYNVTFANDL